jgi:diguanylate cyclase (GGDEF)-like protein/PAS domain S-box-containing protein
MVDSTLNNESAFEHGPLINAVLEDFMGKALHVLLLEDSEADAQLILRKLKQAGYDLSARRVDTAADMREALASASWDVVLADYTMPRFSAPAGLAILKEHGVDIPFLIVAGSIGEETAASLMRAGAHDYINKNQLARLVPAVERELREARERRQRHEAEAALDRAKDRLSMVVSNSPIVLFALDANGVFTLSEGKGLAAMGLEANQVVGRSVFEVYRDAPDIVQAARRALAGETFTEVAEVGDIIFETRYVPLQGKNGEVTGVLGVATDITKHKRAESALRESEKKFRELFHKANDAIFLHEIEYNGLPKTFTDVNDVSCHRLGYTRKELLGLSPLDVTPKDESIEFLRHMRALLLEGDITFETHHQAKDGTKIPVEISAHIFDLNKCKVVFSIARDISERKKAEETIRRQAYHDALTGLPNRMLFKDRLTEAILHARRHDRMLGLLFLDLDRFKNINDTLGHIVGDRLLQGVAERLGSCLQEEDIIARLGGDEFTVLLPQINRLEDAVKTAQRILEALKAPFRFDGHDLHINASIGIALYPSDGEDAEVLLRNADTALYRAKEKGRNTYQLYSPLMNATAFERLVMENSLRRALERGEFVIYFQPLLSIKTGNVVGMEALLRWQHPELGLVYPEEFIPLAEETGIILALGEWTLRAACRQNKLWQEAGLPRLRTSVNLSGRQLQQDGLAAMVARVLEETRLEPQYLELEVTESVAMQNADTTIQVLKDLRSMGIHISLDDFGTGYSSLSYLKRLPLNTLKIDQSFVRDMTTDAHDAAIATTVIILGHNLQLSVTAEGVENQEQLDFLRDQQCDKIQGYLFSQPLPADEFQEFIKQSPALPALARSFAQK